MQKMLLSVITVCVLIGVVAAMPTSASALTAGVVETRGAVGSVYIENQELRFGLRNRTPCSWILRNWKNEIIGRGDWPDEGRGELLLHKLPYGYYMLYIQSDQGSVSGYRSFAVVSDPAKLKRNPEMAFAVDTAQSWLGWPDPANESFSGAGYEIISDLVYLGGFSIVRERLGWNDVEGRRGQSNWDMYQHNADLLDRRGVKISGMFHDAPAWTKEQSAHLPDDLLALYEFCRRLAGHFKGQMADWEFWNEEDIDFTSEPAWNYAAALKAAYLGFKAGNPELPVAVGAMCLSPVPRYTRVVMENDSAEYFDIFNYHTYGPISNYQSLVEELDQVLLESGVAGMPIYFSEVGTYAEGAGREYFRDLKLKVHDSEQEMALAEFVPKSQILLQSLGVSRIFSFVLPPYNEFDGSKDWGLMRRDYTVKPGYVALATLVRMLGDTEYIGELFAPKGVRAFLYRHSDGKQSVAFWSESEFDSGNNLIPGSLKDWKKVGLKLMAEAGKTYEVMDMFGGSSSIKADADGLDLEATRFVSYVTGLSGLSPFVPAKKKVDYVRRKKTDKDKSIIFKTNLSDGFILSVGKDCIDFKEEGPVPFVLEIFNFSEEEKSGVVTVEGAEVSGLPGELRLPAFGKINLKLKMIPPERESGKIVFSGKFNDKMTSLLVMNFFREKIALQHCLCVPLGRTDKPEYWNRNSSGQMEISYAAEENAVCFSTDFPKEVDRWVYPEFTLAGLQESMTDAYGMEFEIKLASGTAVAQTSCVMLVTDNGKSHNLNYVPATENWEKRTVFLEDIVKGQSVKLLRIGMNPTSNKNTFYLRNINILHKKNNEGHK